MRAALARNDGRIVHDRATTMLRRLLLREDELAASSTLGRDHPLARTLGLRSNLLVQLLTTSIPIAFALVGIALHGQRAAVVLGAALVVAVGVVAALLVVRQSTRERARELIAAADDPPRLQLVLSERRRLASRRYRERLARSLEGYLRDAVNWDAIPPRYRPPHEVRCLRFVATDVRAVVRHLRSNRAHVRGVAAVAVFLTESSPLFGGDVVRLRAAVLRLHALLAPETDPRLLGSAA
jgi:hypothetical protein